MPERAEAGVVHHRRQRVRDRVADHAVERGVGSDAAEPELVQQPRGRHLAGRDAVAGVGPAVAAAARPAPASARRPAPSRAGRVRPSRPDRRNRGCRCRDRISGSMYRRAAAPRSAIFTTSAPVDRIARARSARSHGGSPNACSDSTMPRPRRRRVIVGDELGARLDVDELRAGRSARPMSSRSRSSSDPWNPPPSHDARHVTSDRAPPALDRPDRIGTVDEVEAHFHQVGERPRRRARGAAPPSFVPSR